MLRKIGISCRFPFIEYILASDMGDESGPIEFGIINMASLEWHNNIHMIYDVFSFSPSFILLVFAYMFYFLCVGHMYISVYNFVYGSVV